MNAVRLYDSDYQSWLLNQVELLRGRHLNQLDIEHLIEELEGLAKSERRELKSRLRVLLMHLMKWEVQPEERSPGWRGIIVEQRHSIEELLENSPSLRRELEAFLRAEEGRARKLASAETGLPEEAFREVSYPQEKVLDSDFFPDASERASLAQIKR